MPSPPQPKHICKICIELHGRDAKDLIKCPWCEKLSCYFHDRGKSFRHQRECKKKLEEKKCLTL